MRIRMDNNPDFMANIKSAFYAEPDYEFQTPAERESGAAPVQETMKVNGVDVPRWLIYCNYLDTDAAFISPEVIKVRTASMQAPEIPESGIGIVFGELYQNVQERRSGDGKGYSCSFSAQSFTTAAKPSVRREEPKEPAKS